MDVFLGRILLLPHDFTPGGLMDREGQLLAIASNPRAVQPVGHEVRGRRRNRLRPAGSRGSGTARGFSVLHFGRGNLSGQAVGAVDVVGVSGGRGIVRT